jgi:DNA-binding MarR family transcriptional regulator
MSKIEEILDYLKNRKGEPIRLVPLAKELKSPTSTVSAAIYSLRQRGHNITCDRLNGGYTYHEKPPVEEAVPAVSSTVKNWSTLTAQIIQYVSEKKKVTPQQLMDDLKVKRSSLYAFISQIRKHHKIYMKNGVYYYSGSKSSSEEKREEKKGSPDALAANFPWISMSDIMRVPEQERVEMFEAMRKELFYRKIALAFVDATKIAESTIKGVQI